MEKKMKNVVTEKIRITNTFIVKINEEEIGLSFRNPTQEELLAIDLEYRKVFSQCIRNGIISDAEARRIAGKNGSWTKDDEKRITQVSLEISLLESIVKNEDNKYDDTKVEETIGKISNLRNELIDLINQKVDITSNSAEGMANQQKMHKFIQFCCIKSDDSRFFDESNSYEDFVQQNPGILSEIFKQAFFDQYGNPEKITEEWVEIRWLKDKAKRMNEDRAAKDLQEAKDEATKTENEKQSIEHGIIT